MATRRAVLEAARRLFVASGYGSTTIQAIADEADVAVQTVYAAFGNKRSILGELVDAAIAGDDAPIAVNRREWMRPVWDAPTAPERLRAYAAACARINQGAAEVFGVIAAAASTDADVVELAETIERQRRIGAKGVIDSVRAVGRLHPELTVKQATDVLWLLNSPAVYTQLVTRAGWSINQYETWLARAMTSQLLADGVSDRPPGNPKGDGGRAPRTDPAV